MMTKEQHKFAEKIKEQLGYDVDFSTYHITRGRGWSKSDGSCGATIDAWYTFENGITAKVTLILRYTLREYNRKSYKLEEFCDRFGDTWIDCEKETLK